MHHSTNLGANLPSSSLRYPFRHSRVPTTPQTCSNGAVPDGARQLLLLPPPRRRQPGLLSKVSLLILPVSTRNLLSSPKP